MQPFDYYIVSFNNVEGDSLNNKYLKKFIISGHDFYISLTDDEEEAYHFDMEDQANDINHYYCQDLGEVLYYEAEPEDIWVDTDDDFDDEEEDY